MRNAADNPELWELSRHIPRRLIRPPAPGKYGDYVPHYVIAQVLLATVGPFDWTLVEILRGSSTGTVKNERISVDDAVVGAVYRLGVEVDGRPTVIEEVGSVDAYREPNDGERLKKASSDALKRAAMRLGVAIHLWAKSADEFFLPEALRKAVDDADETPLEETDEDPVVGVEEQDEAPQPAAEDPERPFESGGGQETTGEAPQPSPPGREAASGTVTPETIEEAEKNLRDAGLLDDSGGTITLPSGKTMPEPEDGVGWTKLAKSETFIACDHDEARGKNLYSNLVRAVLPDSDKPLEEILTRAEALVVLDGLR